MESLLNAQAWLGAGLIFSLRVVDMTLDTLRMLMVLRGRRLPAWVLGFFQALVFVLAISTVLQGLDNPLYLVGYAAGFASGNVVGMLIEERIALGHIHLRVISSRRGDAIAERLREDGYAVTQISARGREGMVMVLTLDVLRKNIARVRAIVQSVDENAFLTSEDVRPLRRGFWRA